MKKEGNETFMNIGKNSFFEKVSMKMGSFLEKNNSELGETISLFFTIYKKNFSGA